MELNSNVKGSVISIEDNKLVVKAEDGLQHIYSNVVGSKVELGQVISVGDTLGNIEGTLDYRVLGFDLANALQ